MAFLASAMDVFRGPLPMGKGESYKDGQCQRYPVVCFANIRISRGVPASLVYFLSAEKENETVESG